MVLTADPHLMETGFRLGVTSVLLLSARDAARAQMVERTGSYVLLEPADGAVADGVWDLGELGCGFPARHANDGPASAWIAPRRGPAADVEVLPMTLDGPATPPTTLDERATQPMRPASLLRPLSGVDALTPPPRLADSNGPIRRGVRVAVDGAHSEVWTDVRGLASRLVGEEMPVSGDLAVTVRVDHSLTASAYELRVDGGSGSLAAGSVGAIRHGLTTLAQLVHHGMPETVRIEDAPRREMRIVMLDLARRWQEPDVVSRLIDLAAWRKLSHIHLHLTDDEAWRVPSRAHPVLGEIGGVRGHGLPLPPMLGSGSAPTGRAYTPAEIAAWVARAHDLGVDLIPEIDIPAHSHAALTALPELRDPDDTSHAPSVQAFRDNSLVPGHPRTAGFLHDVFGELADLFPHSPTLHLGGDEVAHDAWTRSPIAAEAARAAGVEPGPTLAAVVVATAIAAIESAGRRWAGWEEVASLGLPTTAAHVVAWTSADAITRVAAEGQRVIAAPGEAYYLDMAASDAWTAPGMSWAGTVPLEATCAFVPPEEVAGVQACLWAEHLVDLRRVEEMMFPRLDAVAERGWTGEIRGGADGVRSRSAVQPRFTSENA
jgi:hexosaminidase